LIYSALWHRVHCCVSAPELWRRCAYYLMTGNSFKQHSKDVPQFAPNFTVYAATRCRLPLPEDRKFFLHGEILRAGVRNRRRWKERSGACSRAGAGFSTGPNLGGPEAMVDRRYVVSARSPAGPVAAYWASLGLAPATAERNLQNCRSAFNQSTQCATELEVLRELGVRVVKRSPT
jgi:ribosomal protein S12 methylthiotransferase accessory factor